MQEGQETSSEETATSKSRKKKRKKREARNIQFARGLTADEMILILQLELLRARTEDPPAEVSLPIAIVHDIKFRLSYYAKLFGEVEREKFFEDEEGEQEAAQE